MELNSWLDDGPCTIEFEVEKRIGFGEGAGTVSGEVAGDSGETFIGEASNKVEGLGNRLG
jgi:hypothetical protein